MSGFILQPDLQDRAIALLKDTMRSRTWEKAQREAKPMSTQEVWVKLGFDIGRRALTLNAALFSDKNASRCALEEKLPDSQVWKTSARSHRAKLWETWQIQFISWGDHPAIKYSNSAYRHYKKWKGWTLGQDWEIKIDFLEKVVLFDANPEQLDKPWQVAIAKAREEKIRFQALKEQRQQEQTRIGQMGYEAWQQELERQARLSPEELKAEREAGMQLIMEEMLEQERKNITERAARFAQGLCQWCGVSMVTLMMDCPSCKRSYE